MDAIKAREKIQTYDCQVVIKLMQLMHVLSVITVKRKDINRHRAFLKNTELPF